MGEGKDRKMKKTDLRGILFLVFAAMIWGFALVAQKAGTENLGPLTFTGLRCMLGSLSMIPLIIILDGKKTPEQKEAEHNPAILLKGGMLCGLEFFPSQFFSKSVFNTQPLENLVLSLRSISY